MNSGRTIREIKGRMEAMQTNGGARNWQEWQHLQGELAEEYKKEEAYWQQRSRVQWL